MLKTSLIIFMIFTALCGGLAFAHILLVTGLAFGTAGMIVAVVGGEALLLSAPVALYKMKKYEWCFGVTAILLIVVLIYGNANGAFRALLS